MSLALLMKKNAWLFSSAKNIQFQNEVADLVTDKEGKVRSFSDFKNDVIKKHETYNVSYLQAEYQTALASSQAAKKWQDIQRRKDRYPNLEYKTLQDDHVRDEHKALHGIIRPVDHDFWKTYYPPNGWRCRCYVSQTNKASNGDDVPEVSEKKVPKIFIGNLAILGAILPLAHPYFKNLAKSVKEGAILDNETIKSIPYAEVKSFENGGKVLIHPFAERGPNNIYLKENYKGALYIAESLGHEVKIQYNLNGAGRNPEYLINGVVADLKKPLTQPNKVIKKALQQGCKIVVFNTENYAFDNSTLINQVRGNFKSRIKNKEKLEVESIIVIHKGKVEEINFKELMQ
jgi:SPP1 gp7 family putative phage head morphogenesis protein